MTDLNALALPDLYAELSRGGAVRRLLELARDEDVGPGDATTAAIIPADKHSAAALRARSAGVLAGLAAMGDLLAVFAPSCSIEAAGADGERFSAGQTLWSVSGPLREILALERTMLNLVSRLCGVATTTARYAAALAAGGGRAKLYDTRKTTPGMRVLEKYAVRCGGGRCHRIGLFDAVLVKDNHVAGLAPREFARAVAEAGARARAAGPLRFVECEVDSLAQLDALLELPGGAVDIVLLDNMGPDTLREAVARRDRAGRPIELEASGGVTLETIGAIGATGVDRVSVGALTHSATALDIGLDID